MTDIRDDPRIDAVRQRIDAVSDRMLERIAHGAEILAEAKMRESMADPETWRKLRRLYPSPTVLEGN